MKHMALKKNLDVTIHEAFLEEILQGNWKPGQALNLDELAERYGVSRTPIQQALKRMHTHRPDPAHRSGFPPDTGGTGREPLSQ